MTDKPKPEEQTEAATESEVLLQWVCHPIKSKSVLITIFLVLMLTVLVSLTYYWTESKLFAALAALILWGSLSQYFLPVGFVFNDKDVVIKYTTHRITKGWHLFRSYYVDRNGVLLSPFVRPSRLESFRGLYIRFAGNKDEVMAVVMDKIKMVVDEV